MSLLNLATSNAKDFRKHFDAIPAEKWTTGTFQDNGCSCALGHLGMQNDNDSFNVEANRLTDLVIQFGRALYGDELIHLSVTGVNDGHNIRYNQDTPKKRIIALCNDMVSVGL